MAIGWPLSMTALSRDRNPKPPMQSCKSKSPPSQAGWLPKGSWRETGLSSTCRWSLRPWSPCWHVSGSARSIRLSSAVSPQMSWPCVLMTPRQRRLLQAPAVSNPATLLNINHCSMARLIWQRINLNLALFSSAPNVKLSWGLRTLNGMNCKRACPPRPAWQYPVIIRLIFCIPPAQPARPRALCAPPRDIW